MSEVSEFRTEVSAWLQENCPDGAKGPGQISMGSSKIKLEPDVALWLERCAERGFTAPTWPTEYGGGGPNPPPPPRPAPLSPAYTPSLSPSPSPYAVFAVTSRCLRLIRSAASGASAQVSLKRPSSE